MPGHKRNRENWILFNRKAYLYALGSNQPKEKPKPDLPVKTSERCTSDEECGEGFSCWYKIPRGPLPGIRGLKERPGTCWSNDIISILHNHVRKF